jgi:ubiquinone/menaquinone biosynthesis C-methylase UbiE
MEKTLEQAGELRKLWSNFQSSRVLMSANNYRVFDILKTDRSSAEVAQHISTDRRATEMLLDALTGLDLLKKRNDKYRNTKIASRFLVSGSPYFQGDIIRHAETLWKNWTGLDKVLKTGAPHHTSRNHTAFILGMHNLAVVKVKQLIDVIGLRGVKRALDLGGGPGTYAREIEKRGVHAVLFDTPETIKIARRLLKKSDGVNVEFYSGDFLSDSIGRGYDLILISHIFHSYSAKENIKILKKCNDALNRRGRVVIQEFFVKEDRTYPAWSALFSINMLVNTREGRCYSPGEMKSWLLETGFTGIRKQFVADSFLMSAKK